MVQIQVACVCRSAQTGPVMVASLRTEDAEVAFSSSSTPPSDFEICRLLSTRAQLYTANEGKIELERLVLHYKVLLPPPCTLCYVCVAEPSFSVAEAQLFLATLHGEVVSDPRSVQLLPQASDLSLQELLAPTLRHLLMAENDRQTNPQTQKMSDLQRQVQDVKAVMTENVQRIIERGERLDDMEQRTDALAQSSESFKSSARRVQRKFCQQNAKWTVITIVGTLVVLTVVILIILASAGVFKH